MGGITKAYIAQLLHLLRLAIAWQTQDDPTLLHALNALPDLIEKILNHQGLIEMAHQLMRHEHLLIIGRGLCTPPHLKGL